VNYDNSLVVTITVTCYSWAPSSGDPLFTCGAIYRLHPPTFCSKIAPMIIRNLNALKRVLIVVHFNLSLLFFYRAA